MAKPNSTETPASNSPTIDESKRTHWFIVAGIVAIALATIFVYWPCRHGDFLWDGALLITNNPLVKAPDGLIRIWFSWEPVDYWPVTYSMFWLQWHLFGNNPTGYHDTNMVLHIFSALLVWMILRRLSVPGAFLAALLFAIHPVNVESVAWIAQLKNTLSMFFFLLSVLWFLNAEPDLIAEFRSAPPSRSERDQSTPLNFWYWLSLGAFIFAMLSKGSVAIQPLILLLIIWWKRNRITRANLLRTLPFFVVAAVLTVVNIWFQTHGSGETIRVVTPLERLLGAGAVPWFYLYKALVPLNLVFVYPQWEIHASNPLWWLPLVATIVVTAFLIWQRNHTLFRPLLVAWVFLWVALIPVMGLTDITFMKFSLVADRYQYIAIIGILALLAAAVITFLHRLPSQFTVAVAAVLVVIAAFLAHQRTYIYLDSNTMYQSIIAKNPECWLAYVNRGIGLFDAGDVDAAIASYQKALQIDPNNIEGQNALGAALAKQGHYEAAIDHYRHALKIKPDYAEAHGNLGFALAKTGSSDDALKEMQLALRINPDLPEVSFNLAHHFKQLGRFSDALLLYKHTLRLQPDNPQVHNNLGVLLAAMGDRHQAMQHYQESLRLDPKQAEPHCNLADALVDLGQSQQAVEHYLQALQIDANNVAAHNGLGTVYLNSQQLLKAIEQFQQALQSDPNFPKAHNNLGAALVQSGQPQQAIQHYQEAIRLDPAYIEAYANLATTLAELDQRDEAIAAAEKAIALAQSSNKQTLAAQITSWLTDYRAHQSPPAASSTNSTRPKQKP